MRQKNFTGYYVKRGLTTVAAIAFVLWWSFGSDWSASSEQKRAVRDWLQRMPIYAQNAKYMDHLLDDNHGRAFSSAYTRGSRHRVARMDQESYMRNVLHGMANDAAHDGKLDIANAIRHAHEVLINR